MSKEDGWECALNGEHGGAYELVCEKCVERIRKLDDELADLRLLRNAVRNMIRQSGA